MMRIWDVLGSCCTVRMGYFILGSRLAQGPIVLKSTLTYLIYFLIVVRCHRGWIDEDWPLCSLRTAKLANCKNFY